MSHGPSRGAWLVRAMGLTAELDLTRVWTKGIKLVLSLLILTILVGLAGGVVKTFLDLRLLFSRPVEVALRQVIIDTLILLAVVEVFKTTLTYFAEGRVKVTFIVDTILVVMLTEVIAQWFKGEHLVELAVLGGILLTLGAVRVLAVRFSPFPGEGGRDSG
ncbi:MAG: phosphate-starvation-inducible PsiE family protein [Nitrospirota bacterium]